MALGKNETKSRGTRSTKEVLSEQEKDAAKAAANRKDQDVAVSQAKANIDIMDSEESAVLAEAIELGQELALHPEFEEALTQSVDFKKEENYKSIRMLGLLERFLSPSQLARLPWPGSEKKDAELDALKLPADKRPNILIYDKVKGSGRGANSYYRSLVLATHAGSKANEEKNALISQIAGDKKTSPSVEDETLAINQMLSAIKTAAKIRIQLDKIKKLKNIKFLWIRDDDEEALPSECDTTMSYIEGASPVRKSTKVMWFLNTSASKPEPQRLSIGSVLRWKISDEMMDRGFATLTGDKGLMESTNKTLVRDPATGKTSLQRPKTDSKPASVPTARDVHSWTELVTNMDAMVSYLRGVSPAEHDVRYKEWKGSMVVSPDETLWSAFVLKTMLDATFADESLVAKARAYDAKIKAA